MKIIENITHFALSYFPVGLKTIIINTMPIRIKRILGAKVMKANSEKGGTVIVNDGRKFKVIEDRVFLRVLFEKEYEP
jgi:hypothetical protein